MAQLTTNGLRAKWSGKNRWLSDSGTRGAGRLLARLRRSGVFFYFLQYYLADTWPMAKGVSSCDLHPYIEQQRIEVEQQQAQAALVCQIEQEAAADALTHAERFSLRRFLTAYVEHQPLQEPRVHGCRPLRSQPRLVSTDDFVAHS